jgi:hypothetical protein
MVDESNKKAFDRRVKLYGRADPPLPPPMVNMLHVDKMIEFHRSLTMKRQRQAERKLH